MNDREKFESLKYSIRISSPVDLVRRHQDFVTIPTRLFRNATLIYQPPSGDLLYFFTENNELVVVPWAMVVHVIPEKSNREMLNKEGN